MFIYTFKKLRFETAQIKAVKLYIKLSYFRGENFILARTKIYVGDTI